VYIPGLVVKLFYEERIADNSSEVAGEANGRAESLILMDNGQGDGCDGRREKCKSVGAGASGAPAGGAGGARGIEDKSLPINHIRRVLRYSVLKISASTDPNGTLRRLTRLDAQL
jgi:hypothetical protein